MGYLYYGTHNYDFDDRTLAHLRKVITSKMAMQESFLFTWVGCGIQHSIWINPGTCLYYKFDSASTHKLNREWIAELTRSANSSAGLQLTAEPS